MTEPLPQLPDLVSLPALKTPEKVVLALIAQESLAHKDATWSQRYMAMHFNRADRHSPRKWLSTLLKANLIEIGDYSNGLRPHSYRLSPRVLSNENLLAEVRQLGNALYGPFGLLAEWKYPATWGHGALNTSGTLVLATFIFLQTPTTSDLVRSYLHPLVQPRTTKNAISKLFQHGVLKVEANELLLHDRWEENLTDFLDSCPAGTERLIRGNDNRRREWNASQEFYRGSGLSNYDLLVLHGLPCVYCKMESTEQEHFPPQRFLDFHKVGSDRHHIWAVCRTCNGERSDFIKSLPLKPLPMPIEWHFEDDANVGAINRASANFHLRRFNQAFTDGDRDAAVNAINATIMLMRVIGAYQTDQSAPSDGEQRPSRRQSRTLFCTTEQSQVEFQRVARMDPL